MRQQLRVKRDHAASEIRIQLAKLGMLLLEVANGGRDQEVGEDTKIMNIFGYSESGGQVGKEIVDYNDIALSRTGGRRCDPGIACHLGAHCSEQTKATTSYDLAPINIVSSIKSR